MDEIEDDQIESVKMDGSEPPSHGDEILIQINDNKSEEFNMPSSHMEPQPTSNITKTSSDIESSDESIEQTNQEQLIAIPEEEAKRCDS